MRHNPHDLFSPSLEGPESGAARPASPEAGREEARALAARLRGEVHERGLAILERLAAWFNPGSLAVLALAAILAAFLAQGCAPPGPRASVTVLDCSVLAGPPPILRLTYRLEVGEGPALSRYGLTLHARTDAGEYWASELVSEDLPPGSAISCQRDIELRGPGEVILDYEIVDLWYD